MSDFVIKKTAKHGSSPIKINADDLIISADGKTLRYIEPHTHKRKEISMDEDKNYWRERHGLQGGPAFTNAEIPLGWKRPK